VPLEALEQQVGDLLSEEEREEIDTLGGLVVSLAGRVPIQGELIRHPSGLEFEVLEADPRRITHVRVRQQDNIGKQLTPESPVQAADPR
jgi:CBS domain containing-hemolysin-like protein